MSQDLKDEFEGKEPQLEDVTNLGSQLVDHSGPTTSSEAVKAKLSDTNHTWDDLMDALDRREESLKGGQEKALGYQDCLDNLSKWLKEVEEKLDEPEKTTGDPVEIANQCAETKVCTYSKSCMCVYIRTSMFAVIVAFCVCL